MVFIYPFKNHRGFGVYPKEPQAQGRDAPWIRSYSSPLQQFHTHSHSYLHNHPPTIVMLKIKNPLKPCAYTKKRCNIQNRQELKSESNAGSCNLPVRYRATVKLQTFPYSLNTSKLLIYWFISSIVH